MSDNIEYVYCASNECMSGIVKIGKTNRNPHIRIKEIGNFTGCPIPFTLNHYIKVKNSLKYETIVHNILNDFRINKNREFFKIESCDSLKYFNKNILLSNGGSLNDFVDDYLVICNEDKNIDIDIDINNQNNKFKKYIKNKNKNKNNNNDNDVKNKYIYNKCNKCGKEFEYKYQLVKHENRKFSCETTDNINSVYENKIKVIDSEIDKKTKLSLEKKIFVFYVKQPYQ